MLVHVYPPDHKKAGRRKAEKDLTDAERRDWADQRRLYEGGKRRLAESFLARIEESRRVVKSAK